MNPTVVNAGRALVLAGTLTAFVVGTSVAEHRSVAHGCEGVGTPVAGMAGMDHHGMMAGLTPVAGMHEMDFDLLYMDMMIPHHESVIALAEVARVELSHPDLIDIAERIVETQDAEILEMQELRDAWYPGAEPVPMEMMMTMPGMGSDMAVMDQQMSAAWQVQAFCAADDRDLAFIEQVIRHHQMAIDTSLAADELAVHPELAAIAQRVIADQQHEIDELNAIRAELTGEATPAP